MSRADIPGSCFGFAVRSSLNFAYLRESDGAREELEVTISADAGDDDEDEELLFEWKPSSRFPRAGRLTRSEPGFRLWVDTWGSFMIDPAGSRISMPDAANVIRREERLWSIPAMLCFLNRGDAALHAAAVEVGGEALVLAAPGTFGKTTLAAAFHSAGHRLLSEDTTCVREVGHPAIVPGPAMLRIRHDVAAQMSVPAATAVETVPDDRMHLALDPSVRGDAHPVPLRAIVLLRRSDDGIAVERANAADAVRDLWSLSFRLPTDEDRARCFAAVTRLVRSVPVWNLRRPLTVGHLAATVDHVIRRV